MRPPASTVKAWPATAALPVTWTPGAADAAADLDVGDVGDAGQRGRQGRVVGGRAAHRAGVPGRARHHRQLAVADHPPALEADEAGGGGGDVDAGTIVDEEWMLALEREGFMSLLDHPKTQERIMGMLQTGKPVRN